MINVDFLVTADGVKQPTEILFTSVVTGSGSKGGLARKPLVTFFDSFNRAAGGLGASWGFIGSGWNTNGTRAVPSASASLSFVQLLGSEGSVEANIYGTGSLRLLGRRSSNSTYYYVSGSVGGGNIALIKN